MTACTGNDVAGSLDQVARAVTHGDYAAALQALQEMDAELRARQAESCLPDLATLRQLHDGTQGLLGVVIALREETRTELGRLQRRHQVAAEYVAV